MAKSKEKPVTESVKCILYLLNKNKKDFSDGKIHVDVNIYCRGHQMPRLPLNEHPTSIYLTTEQTAEQNRVSTSEQELAKFLDAAIPQSTEKAEKISHTSFTGNNYEQTKPTKSFLEPTASRTAVSPPTKDDREKARRYWDNPRFGLSRLESATEFEQMPLGQSHNEKKQQKKNNGFGRFHWPSRKKP
jgi:hypothetical protein